MDIKPVPTIEENIAAPANKRFRSLIQELFSLVEELYAENDRLSQESSTLEELKIVCESQSQEIQKLQASLIWLSSRELDSDSVSGIKSEIRRVVADTLRGSEIVADKNTDIEYTKSNGEDND